MAYQLQKPTERQVTEEATEPLSGDLEDAGPWLLCHLGKKSDAKAPATKERIDAIPIDVTHVVTMYIHHHTPCVRRGGPAGWGPVKGLAGLPRIRMWLVPVAHGSVVQKLQRRRAEE